MEKRIRKYFISLIIGLLIIILIAGIILFDNTMQKVYLTQMEQTNKNLAEQISSSFELVIKQIAEQVNKLAIYDNEIVELVHNHNLKISNNIKLYNNLEQIVMGNQYIHSVYLYSEDEKAFFDSERGNCFKAEEFFDQAVLDAVASKYLTTVPPHLINKEVLIYSIIVPLKLTKAASGRCVLCVNIDVGMLYKDIMKRNSGNKDVELYVYDEKDKILISKNFEDLNKNISEKQQEIESAFPNQGFWSALNKKAGVMDAITFSFPLKCNFYVQVPFAFNFTRMFNNYFVLVMVLLLFIVAIIIAYIILCFTTRPIKDVLTDYNDKLLKDMLISSCHGKYESLQQALMIDKYFKYNGYSLLLIDVNGNQLEIYKTVSAIIDELPVQVGSIMLKHIPIYGNRVAVICNYNNISAMEQLENTYLRQLYQRLNERYLQQVYIAVSLGKTDPALLSVAFMECDEIQQYKLSISEHIINYYQLQEKKNPIIYPVELEKQLINNLLVKNTEGCIFYTNKFLKHILEEDGLLNDIQIKNYIYQLENEILTRISSLPISIKTTGSSDMKNINNRSQINDMLMNFIQSICSEIAKKNPNNESIINEAIIEYINANLTEDDFNLNSISYQFNLNRNYLAKMIKEETSYCFNDYINIRKISLSKDLLATTLLTIEEIAHRTGFSYAHYFIKVFKNLEGITPGQYREMQINNNNA